MATVAPPAAVAATPAGRRASAEALAIAARLQVLDDVWTAEVDALRSGAVPYEVVAAEEEAKLADALAAGLEDVSHGWSASGCPNVAAAVVGRR